MKRVLALSLVSLFVASCAAISSTEPLVERALDALGGADALIAAKTHTLKGTVRQFDTEQSYAPGGDAKHTSDSEFVLSTDGATRTTRVDWVRNFHYPFQVTRTFREIVTPDAGYVIGVDSFERNWQSRQMEPAAHAMSSMRLATVQRELRRASPTLLLEMRQNPGRVSARLPVSMGTVSYPALDYRVGDLTYTVMFDPVTGLPVRIRTLDHDNIWGDVDYDLVLSDWRTMAGVRVATHQQFELRGTVVQDMRITELNVSSALPPNYFEAPVALKQSAAKPATGRVPYQWVIRRQFIGTYVDSENASFDAGAPNAGLSLVEIAPGVQHQVGGSHNTLIVEMSDHLIAFDAPVSDWHSNWTLTVLKARHPGKPVRYLVLTHHHMDHAGGLRAYLAQGATLVVGQGAGAHFKRSLAAPFARNPDLAPNNLSVTRVIEVADKQVFTDGRREVSAHRIDNPHAQGFLMGYVVDQRLAYVTDLWAPGRPLPGTMNPGLAAVVDGVKKAGIAPLRFAGGHGAVAPYAILEGLAALTAGK